MSEGTVSRHETRGGVMDVEGGTLDDLIAEMLADDEQAPRYLRARWNLYVGRLIWDAVQATNTSWPAVAAKVGVPANVLWAWGHGEGDRTRPHLTVGRLFDVLVACDVVPVEIRTQSYAEARDGR